MHVRLPARCKSKLRHACVCPCVKKSEPNQSRVTSIEETCPRKSPQQYPVHPETLPIPLAAPQDLASRALKGEQSGFSRVEIRADRHHWINARHQRRDIRAPLVQTSNRSLSSHCRRIGCTIGKRTTCQPFLGNFFHHSMQSIA